VLILDLVFNPIKLLDELGRRHDASLLVVLLHRRQFLQFCFEINLVLATRVYLVHAIIVELLFHLSFFEPSELLLLGRFEFPAEFLVYLVLYFFKRDGQHRLHYEDQLAKADRIFQSANQIMVFTLKLLELTPEVTLVCDEFFYFKLQFLEVCFFEFAVSLIQLRLFFVHHCLPLLECLC